MLFAVSLGNAPSERPCSHPARELSKITSQPNNPTGREKQRLISNFFSWNKRACEKNFPSPDTNGGWRKNLIVLRLTLC
jgi:hypothetical protein